MLDCARAYIQRKMLVSGPHCARFKLDNLVLKRTVRDDTWNKVPLSEMTLEYFAPRDTKTPVAFIDYHMATGQIGLLFVNTYYQRNGIGSHLVRCAIDDMKKYGTATSVWAITFNHKHDFWERVLGGVFKMDNRPHVSVMSGGYSVHLGEL